MAKRKYIDNDEMLAPWQQDTMDDTLLNFEMVTAEKKKPLKLNNKKVFNIPIKGKSLSPIFVRKRKTTPDIVTKEQGCEPMD